MIKLVLFFNNNTNGNPNAPYFTGKLTLEDGTELKTALWTNVSGAGQTYYSGHAKPIEPNPVAEPTPTDPKPADQPTEPGPDEPATKEFIDDVIKDWEARQKIDFPDMGRRKLEPPRNQDNNAFLKRLKYNEAKAFLNTFQKTHVDDITDDMAEEYYKAKTFILEFEADRQDLFPN
jgi:hypothetical protein